MNLLEVGQSWLVARQPALVVYNWRGRAVATSNLEVGQPGKFNLKNDVAGITSFFSNFICDAFFSQPCGFDPIYMLYPVFDTEKGRKFKTTILNNAIVTIGRFTTIDTIPFNLKYLPFELWG